MKGTIQKLEKNLGLTSFSHPVRIDVVSMHVFQGIKCKGMTRRIKLLPVWEAC